MTTAIWICSVLTIVSALVSLGYAAAGLRSASPSGRLPSSYALSRSMALVVVALAGPFTGNTGFIEAAAVCMICVQLLDAVIGGRSHDLLKTIGPAITAAVNATALVWVFAN
ncbi:MAG: hypothetical protein JWQ19_211 [Subtercola sp.]|nr:hypothetical protein [Subtercola sp.]